MKYLRIYEKSKLNIKPKIRTETDQLTQKQKTNQPKQGEQNGN